MRDGWMDEKGKQTHNKVERDESENDWYEDMDIWGQIMGDVIFQVCVCICVCVRTACL